MPDVLIPFRWEALTDVVLPPLRALVLTEDTKPLLQLIKKALQQLPVKTEAQIRGSRARDGVSELRHWFALYSLAPLVPSGTEDLVQLLAHLVSPQGRRDTWGEEYALRVVQLFRGFRTDLSKRLANALWPVSLQDRTSPAADIQLDELFAELVLFFAAPRFLGRPEGGEQAIFVELEGQLWHTPVAFSQDGFFSWRDLYPALFRGSRRPPFSQERQEETETRGPLTAAETREFFEKIERRADVDKALRALAQRAAEQNWGLLLWKEGA